MMQRLNKTVLVTGATDGIGKQTALELAQLGAHVVIHGRSEERCVATIKELERQAHEANFAYAVADFTSLQQIRDMAKTFQDRHKTLDILINNAGVFMHRRTLTQDGIETTFAVNHLAPFLLTNLLLPLLHASKPARVITVSSNTHHGAHLDMNNLQGERSYSGYSAYSASKLANVLFSNELAERVKSDDITSNSLHPGVISTKLLGAGWGAGGNDLTEGASTPVYLATSPDVERTTGKYFVRSRETKPNPLANDVTVRQQLWQESARLVGL
jgi:NAD(P)-dependent dehydrogenase (short-subunit alcohol dehydrogenase family)